MAESGYPNTVTSPAHNGVAVTPSDSGTIPATRALWVGGAGNIAVDWAGGGTNVTITGVNAGQILPFEVTRVYSTNTTATSIVALY